MFNLASAPRASDWQNFGNEIVRINKELQKRNKEKANKTVATCFSCDCFYTECL